MIKRENKFTFVLIAFVLFYLSIDTFVFSNTVVKNQELLEVLTMNLEVGDTMRTRLNSCTDMLKVYKEVDLYAYPH